MVIRPAETGADVQNGDKTASPAQGPSLFAPPTFLPTPGDHHSHFPLSLYMVLMRLARLDAKDKLWEDLLTVIRGNISL